MAAFQERLQARVLGRKARWFTDIASTNDFVKAHAQELEHGTIIGAHTQRAGRGTQGRRWESPPGHDLYFSICLKDERLVDQLPLLTLATALAVQLTLEDLGFQPEIKWPNDILLADKKVCGILIETAVHGRAVSHCVVGIGINVNRRAFSELLRNEATSLALVSGVAQDRAALLAQFLNLYEVLLTTPFEEIVAHVQERLAWVGQEVEVDAERGVLVGIDARGALRLRTNAGEKSLVSGHLQREG